MKHIFLSFLLAAQLLSFARAQSIDPHEIIRRGNRVEVVNAAETHAQSSVDADVLAAFAPPANDSHKWFITVITLDGCAPCKRLLADWQSSPALAAFAQPGNARASWAHLNIYAAEDETQTWRWQNIVVKSYPTILLQPPRNGRYGNAATVVLQKSGYNGVPGELAGQLRAAIEKQAGRWSLGAGRWSEADTIPTSFEQKSPPFAPPAKPQPNAPSVDPLPLLPAIPPSVDPDTKPTPTPTTPTEPAPLPDVLPDPAKGKFPQHPEAVVIVDKLAESSSDAAMLAQIQRVLARLRAERPGLVVRLLDVREARQYPVAPRELPAVLTTNEGRLETKLDRTLLPIVAAEPPPFPWTTLVGLLANGFNWAGIAALVVWAAATIRARRKAAGQKLLLDDELVQQVRAVVEELLKSKTNV